MSRERYVRWDKVCSLYSHENPQRPAKDHAGRLNLQLALIAPWCEACRTSAFAETVTRPPRAAALATFPRTNVVLPMTGLNKVWFEGYYCTSFIRFGQGLKSCLSAKPLVCCTFQQRNDPVNQSNLQLKKIS